MFSDVGLTVICDSLHGQHCMLSMTILVCVCAHSCVSHTVLLVLLFWLFVDIIASETFRPHHRCTRQPSLAAGSGAHTV